MNEGTYPPGAISADNHTAAMQHAHNSLNAVQPLPPRRQKARLIQIQQLDHGFHVEVGCQNFAVESVDALIHRLNVYLKNPEDAEQKWLTGDWKF